MTDYHKKTKTELIRELKESQKECARLAAIDYCDVIKKLNQIVNILARRENVKSKI